ncbi:hypothetical protein UlMin_026914 [Ulmus minor]
MVTYLTEVWKLTYTQASAIVNIFWGIVAILPFTLQYIVDTFMGNFWMVLISSFAYSLGLGFLSMSTPPVLSRETNTCREYKPECISKVQNILFYTALPLIAIGMSGHLTSLRKFVKEQNESSTGNEVQEQKRTKEQKGKCHWSLYLVILVPLIGAIVIPYIKPWKLRFGIPSIVTVAATLIFLTGSCQYRKVKVQGSSLTTVFRVSVASTSKLFHSFPTDASQLYERHDDLTKKMTPTRHLRFLDKAAVIVPNIPLEQQQLNRWRLCTVTEVEETKSIICMIPLCMTFFVLGVVSSIGNTYFLEQANHMNRKVGKLKVPLPMLVLLRDKAKSRFSKFYFKLMANDSAGEGTSPKRYTARVGIGVSMIFAVQCCISAAKVEDRRLHVVRKHGLVYKPEERIPMSMLWLLPQFLLLGGLDGISQKSIQLFFNNQTPASMDRYMAHFATAVSGVGTIGSVFSVYLVGEISTRGGHPSWFQDTLNRSRLDKYYWVLAALTAVNFLLYILMAIWYSQKDLRTGEQMEAPVCNQATESFD